jgi:O-antigen ligase
MPLLVWMVFLMTVVSTVVGDLPVLGYNVRGWAWVAPFVVALQGVVSLRKKPTFPFWIWVPWCTLLLAYAAVSSHEHALQRTLMMISPILIGTAVSLQRIDAQVLSLVHRRLRQGAGILFAVVVVKAGVTLTGGLPEITGLAAEVMTGNILAAVFAAGFAFEVPGMFALWALMAVLPVVAVTRTVTVSTAVTLPLTFAPLSLRRRAGSLLLLAAVALLVFQTERFQRKMFYSGRGELTDLSLENQDFRTTGRLRIWEVMDEEIMEKPWFGHGANAQEDFLLTLLSYRSHPHNDWMRLLFDYGYAGAALFALTLLFQMLHSLRRGRSGPRVEQEARVLYLSGAGLFLTFAAVMLTDNIILYASFFGNLHFTLLGLAYAADETARPAAAGTQPPQSRVSTWIARRERRKVGP